MKSKILSLLFSSVLMLSFTACSDDDVVVTGNEGAVGSAVSLTLGTTHTGTVGTYAAGEDYSYYTFTTTSTTGYYSVLIDNLSQYADLDMYVYNDSGFTSLNDFSFANDTSFYLNASTTYYLKVNNWSGTNNIIYDLLVTAP